MQCPRDCPYWRSSATVMQRPDILTSSSSDRKNRERLRCCFPEIQGDCSSYRSYRDEAKSLETRAVPFQSPTALWQHLNYRYMYQSTRNLNPGYERFLPPVYVGGRLRTYGDIHPLTFPVSCAGAFSPFWRVQEQHDRSSGPRRSLENERFSANSREDKSASCETSSVVNEEQSLWRTKGCASVLTTSVQPGVNDLTKGRILLKSTSCEVRPASTRKSSNHENAWGGPTYTELITEAILSTPEHRMTLSQIYDWITENVEYFRERKNFTSARGWKNAIRHTLSLRKRFMRVARTTGAASWYNSWWMINEQYMRGRQVSKERRRETHSSSTSCGTQIGERVLLQPGELQITAK